MRNFVIFFAANTGSSAIISHLKQMKDKLDIVGFEPFDNCHMKQALVGKDLTRMFELLYNKNLDNTSAHAELNKLYKLYNDKPIELFNNKKALGFKMRYRDWDTIEAPIKNNNVVVFILIRQNVFKWALSWYDSSATQFKLIKGEVEKDPKITVDVEKFRSILKGCCQGLNERYKLIEELKKRGVTVVPIYYEEYCENKVAFFRKFFDSIDMKLTEGELLEFANRPNFFKKVHGDNLKQYVVNYEELKKEFGKLYSF